MERLIVVAVGGTIVALVAGITYYLMGKDVNPEIPLERPRSRRSRSSSTSTSYSSLIQEEVLLIK
jgi:hypothetical protein